MNPWNLFVIFQVNVPFLYPLKTSETSGFLIFSGVIEKEQLVWNGLKLKIKQHGNFVETAESFIGVVRTPSNIYDGAFLRK